MCGLFGITSVKNSQLHKVRSAINSMSHRGPDGIGEYQYDHVYSVHARLSIIDLSANGTQPMTDREYGVTISVNGEIYNHLELRRELSKRHQFFSKSDSEVLIHGYKEWGINLLLEKIDGMYAAVIHDHKKKIIYLFRDRYGVKPLYYTNISHQLIWSSELKGIEKFFENSNLLDEDISAYYDFLTYLYIPTPKTIYKNVYKLAPGNLITYDLAKSNYEVKKYWDIDLQKTVSDSYQEAKEVISKLISDSVESQLVADVPVGFFLSAGIDSSTMALFASNKLDKITTFTIGFDNKQYDEREGASLVAMHIGSNHQEKIIDKKNVDELYSNIKTWYDEPFADTSCIPTYLVSKLAAGSCKVVISGDGGDEIFCGYTRYNVFEKYRRHLPYLSNKVINFFRNKPNLVSRKSPISRLKRAIENYLIFDDYELYGRIMGGVELSRKAHYRKHWEIPDDYDDYWYFKKYLYDSNNYRRSLQYLDFKTYLHDDILTKVDRVTMSNSIECRVPFLSKDLVEYMFSLPTEFVSDGNKSKLILRDIISEKLPRIISERKKKGFSIPKHSWFPISNISIQEKILELFNQKCI